jgi:hypothetical protein
VQLNINIFYLHLSTALFCINWTRGSVFGENFFLTQEPVKISDMGNNGKISFYRFSPYYLLGWYKNKQSLYRPWGFQEAETLRTSRQSVHESGKVDSRSQRPPLPQQIFLILISVRSWVDSKAIVRPEGLCQWKVRMIPSGIEPAVFRLVAQRRKQLHHCDPNPPSLEVLMLRICLFRVTRRSICVLLLFSVLSFTAMALVRAYQIVIYIKTASWLLSLFTSHIYQ